MEQRDHKHPAPFGIVVEGSHEGDIYVLEVCATQNGRVPP